MILNHKKYFDRPRFLKAMNFEKKKKLSKNSLKLYNKYFSKNSIKLTINFYCVVLQLKNHTHIHIYDFKKAL